MTAAIAIARVNPAPLDVLELRACARSLLLAEGEIASVAEAVDPLQAFADHVGLVDEFGADTVQAIIAQQFRESAMSPPPKQDFPDDGDVAFGDPTRRERDRIAPGTTGDPNDTMDDFPLIRDAGEKPQAKARKRGRMNGEQEDDGGAALDVHDAGDDTESPPPRRWLTSNQFCRRFLSGLLGPGATGKTALRVLQYLSLATGRPLAGQYIFRRCRVLMLSFEDDQQELQRRILAARLHHGIKAAEVKGWLFYATPKGVKLAEMRNGTRHIGALEQQLRRAIDHYRPDLLGLDPFVKLHALEENDNSAMDFVCDLLTTLAMEYDIAVDAPHHTRKGQMIPGDPEAGRGAGAAKDAGRLVYTLTTMSEDEAKQFGINPEDRATYVRLDKAKVNLAPPARVAEWFKLVGVQLDNGNDEYPSGDEVQTVEPWTPPKLWAGLAAETLNAALTEIDAGMPNGQRYTDAGGGKGERAAWKVVQKHCPSRSEGQCREIIKTWLKNGVLYPAEYDDPIKRIPRKGYRLDTTKRPS